MATGKRSAGEDRTATRRQVEAMTREYLARGGKITRYPPGSAEIVDQKRERESQPGSGPKDDGQPDPA